MIESALTAFALVMFVGLAWSMSRRDPVAVLTVFVIALFAVNARWVLPGAGAIGTPAMVVAVGAAWWWGMARVHPGLAMDSDLNPVRIGLLLYVWFIVLSWGISRLRFLSELEVNSSNRALLTAIGLTGVALLVCDGASNRRRLETLLKRVVLAGTAFAVVGLLQFFADVDFVAMVQVPGLVQNADIPQGLQTRAGFGRIRGTALHSIEFSVVLAMVLPLAIHFAMNECRAQARRRYAIMTVIIGAAIPLSFARSGIIAMVVALLVTAIGWNWRERIIGFATTGFGLIGLGLVVPGLVGTFRWLLFSASDDPSVSARIDRIPRVIEEVSEGPWLGSGIGTFSPEENFLLDNEYFGILLESGILGLLVAGTLIGVSIAMCAVTFSHTRDKSVRRLSMAICAGIVVLAVVMATFDALFFKIVSGLTFLLIGSAGAIWRLEQRTNVPEQYAASNSSISRWAD